MSNLEKSEIINPKNISTQYGITAGLLMASFLFAMQITGNDFRPFIKLLKYLLLGVPIVLALIAYKETVKGDIFINGISLGAKLAFVAGLSLVVINFLLFMINPDIAFSKYGLEPVNMMQNLTVSAIILAETFVFGNLIAFVTLQYLKGSYNKGKV